MKILYFLTIILAVFVCSIAFSQETFTLTTYYPAPFGVYQRLVTQTLGVGDNNTNVAGIDATDAPNPIVAGQAGDVWIAGDVGIGTIAPNSRLSVFNTGTNPQITAWNWSGVGNGIAGYNLRIDATDLWQLITDNNDGNKLFLQFLNNPTNRFLTVNVNGNIGIGTTDPMARLDVAGDAILVPRAASDPATPRNGMIYYNSAANEFRFYENGTWRTLGGQGLHMAKMVRSTAQSIPNGGINKINLNDEIFDYGGIANPGTGSFVIQRSGVYLVTVSWRIGGFANCDVAAGDSEMGTYIYINGSAQGQADSFVKGPDSETGYGLVQDTYYLNTGDVITMYVRHTAGGARDTQTGLDNRPRMSVVQLR